MSGRVIERNTYLNKEGYDIRCNEEECNASWRDQQLFLLPEISRQSAEENIFCSDECTWLQTDEDTKRLITDKDFQSRTERVTSMYMPMYMPIESGLLWRGILSANPLA